MQTAPARPVYLGAYAGALCYLLQDANSLDCRSGQSETRRSTSGRSFSRQLRNPTARFMLIARLETFPISAGTDVVLARQEVRKYATKLEFSLVDLTKLVTAASELARNTLIYGGGDSMRMELLEEGLRRGIRLTFEDQGPGIPDLGRALTDGYTTGRGLGLGLGGAKRLVNEFELVSTVGKGTRVTITRWK